MIFSNSSSHLLVSDDLEEMSWYRTAGPGPDHAIHEKGLRYSASPVSACKESFFNSNALPSDDRKECGQLSGFGHPPLLSDLRQPFDDYLRSAHRREGGDSRKHL